VGCSPRDGLEGYLFPVVLPTPQSVNIFYVRNNQQDLRSIGTCQMRADFRYYRIEVSFSERVVTARGGNKL